MNYRKFYANHYKITIPEGFDIHHIDEDRNNNDIHNLLLLPSKLHHQYHFYRSIAMEWNQGGDLYSQDMGSYSLNSVKSYCKVCKECKEWIALKSYMDGEQVYPLPFPDGSYEIIKQLPMIGECYV